MANNFFFTYFDEQFPYINSIINYFMDHKYYNRFLMRIIWRIILHLFSYIDTKNNIKSIKI